MVKCLFFLLKFEGICLSVVVVNSTSKSGRSYCPQIFLEGFEYRIKEESINTFITNDVDLFSNDSADSDPEKHFRKILDN